MKNKQEAAEKEIEKFQHQYLKLMAKFPRMTLTGDTNGNIIVYTYFGEGLGTKHVQRRLPSFVAVEAK